ncbi:MAG: type II toxin-antitoxin system VapC family toxin [Acidimicrobiaceae bacterium]|nr:type II toxin-antitoxin system VapC family toxin [Acidimicrobiaceae bacterium]MDE0606093.1 type II toxin-antitoxin system VapC family toxin [Acidimicrobiaceae bacterium]
MNAVVDASVLVAALVDASPEGRWAESVASEGPLTAPELALVEATNILRRLELSGQVSPMETKAAQRDLLRLDIELCPFAPFSDRVWELRANLTSYDAWYVALAEAFDYPLLTLDRKLSKAGGTRCPVITPPVLDS